MAEQTRDQASNCHSSGHGNIDLFFWCTLIAVIALYAFTWLSIATLVDLPWITSLSGAVFDLINTIWWGILLGMLMIAVLGKIPREFITAVLDGKSGLQGIIRATLGGVLLDLCSHGILLVGAKLYERGASAGQVVAFLVASPWNSFSLTLVLLALIGWKWTLAFIVLSLVVAIITGLLFERLVANGTLPANPNTINLPSDFRFWEAAWEGLSNTRFGRHFWQSLIIDGYKSSRPIMRWILFGVILASFVKAFVDTQNLQTYFGPSLAGLGLTIVAATIIEVCSEGSAPIAADLLSRAGAPGNGFAFLMTGVSTDYTEIVILRETTHSWKIALFLPLLTVPQVVLISWVLNSFSV